jgi:hypothetical protein
MRCAYDEACSGVSRVLSVLAALCSALALLCATATAASASSSGTRDDTAGAFTPPAIPTLALTEASAEEAAGSEDLTDSDAGAPAAPAAPPPAATPPPPATPPPAASPPPPAAPAPPASPPSEAQPPAPEPAKPSEPPTPDDKDNKHRGDEASGKGKDGEPKSQEPPKGDRPNKDKQPGKGTQPGNGSEPRNGSEPGKGTTPAGESAPVDREDSGGRRDRDAEPKSGGSAATPENERLPGLGAPSPGTQTGPASCAGQATAAGYPHIPPVASTAGPGALGVPETQRPGTRLAATSAPPRSSEISGLLGGRLSSPGTATSLLPDAGGAGPALAAPAPPLDLARARVAAGRPKSVAEADRQAKPPRAEPKERKRTPHGPFGPPSDHTPTAASAAGGSSSNGLARSVIWAVLVMGTVACAARRLRRHRIPTARWVEVHFVPVLERPG